jgi:hypothetical protein
MESVVIVALRSRCSAIDGVALLGVGRDGV